MTKSKQALEELQRLLDERARDSSGRVSPLTWRQVILRQVAKKAASGEVRAVKLLGRVQEAEAWARSIDGSSGRQSGVYHEHWKTKEHMPLWGLTPVDPPPAPPPSRRRRPPKG